MRSSTGILSLWMLALAVASVFSTFTVFESIRDCPSHLKRDRDDTYYRYKNNRCYFYHTSLKSYKDAEKICKRDGGQLATFKSKGSYSFVRATSLYALGIKGAAWIGLNDMERENHYVWSDGTKLGQWDFQHFGEGRGIYGKKSAEKCVAHELVRRYWKEYSCDEKKPFICEFVPVDPPTISLEQCPDNLKRDRYSMVFGNSCYRYNPEIKSFKEAEQYCKKDGGYLVTIKSQGVNSFLQHWLKVQFIWESDYNKTQIWIGLNDIERDNHFVWSDGTKMGDYQNFKGAQGIYMSHFDKTYSPPDRCVSMKLETSRWRDNVCTVDKSFICEYKPKAAKRG